MSPATEPRTDTDTALRTADVLWSALRDRLEPEEHIGYGRLYEQMYSWMLDRAEAAQGATPRAEGRITVMPPASWSEGAADLLERALYLPSMTREDAEQVEKAIRDHLDAEHCHHCGQPVGLVWTAPDDLWAAVTGITDGGGIRCIPCFDKAAAEQGRFIRWVPQQEQLVEGRPINRDLKRMGMDPI